ncbi:MAG: cytochrome b/b6 domain-containing protein [Gammaproteobacteria bacterium]
MVTMDASRAASAGVRRYGRVAIALHWSMFLLVIWVGALGLLHDTWPKQTQAFWINLHAMFGLLLWLLLVLRFTWRLKHPPPMLNDVGEFSRRLSGPVHLALYGLMFIIPLIGVVTFIWHGRVFDFGLFRLDPGVRSNRAVFHPTEDIHGYLAYALFALAGLHALAALWHHWVKRDDVLRRMWP